MWVGCWLLMMNILMDYRYFVCLIIVQFSTDMAVMQFIKKMLSMLKENEQVIGWSESGTQIEIFDLHAFTSNVLPRHFRHNNLGSFVRQLNMYGFQKISRKKSEMIFQHEHFREGQTETYHLIKRKGKNQIQEQSNPSNNIQINEEMEHLKQIDKNLAELLNKLLTFKEKNRNIYKKLKLQLDKLPKIVSTKKEKPVRMLVTDIKDQLRNINQAQKKLQHIIFKNVFTKEPKSNDDPSQEEVNAKKDQQSSTLILPQERNSIPQIPSISNFFNWSN